MNGEGEWTYRCSQCEMFHPADHFHNDNSKPPFFLAYTCRDCRSKEPTYRTWEREHGEYILYNVLGYSKDKPIHEQLEDRVRVKYKFYGE